MRFGTFVISGEVDIRVVPTVVLFDILVRYEKLGALIALIEVSFLLGWKLKQILVG